jgi:hypothetical protein
MHEGRIILGVLRKRFRHNVAACFVIEMGKRRQSALL